MKSHQSKENVSQNEGQNFDDPRVICGYILVLDLQSQEVCKK